jgi:hypothetical protein
MLGFDPGRVGFQYPHLATDGYSGMAWGYCLEGRDAGGILVAPKHVVTKVERQHPLRRDRRM